MFGDIHGVLSLLSDGNSKGSFEEKEVDAVRVPLKSEGVVESRVDVVDTDGAIDDENDRDMGRGVEFGEVAGKMVEARASRVSVVGSIT